VPPSRTRRGAAVLVALQGLGLLAVGGFTAVEVVVATASSRAAAATAAVLALAYGVLLLVVARGVDRAQRWARAPVLVTELILIPVSVGLLQSGRWYVGAPVLLTAAAALVLVFVATGTPEAD
jgi:uncharacterized membrane protein (DUF2068 family)